MPLSCAHPLQDTELSTKGASAVVPAGASALARQLALAGITANHFAAAVGAGAV